MLSKESQNLRDIIYSTIASINRQVDAPPLDAYLKCRYGTNDIEEISPSQYREVFDDLFQMEADLRD